MGQRSRSIPPFIARHPTTPWESTAASCQLGARGPSARSEQRRGGEGAKRFRLLEPPASQIQPNGDQVSDTHPPFTTQRTKGPPPNQAPRNLAPLPGGGKGTQINQGAPCEANRSSRFPPLQPRPCSQSHTGYWLPTPPPPAPLAVP